MPTTHSLKRWIFPLTAIATLLYLGWRTFFTLPFGYGAVSMVVAVLLLLSEIFAGFEALEQYLNMVFFKEPEMPTDVPKAWYPDVDVFVTTHNEETDVVFKTVNACLHMEYPDKKKVHIYICDDMDRPEMNALAKRMGVGYLGLSDNKHAKAGNLNNAINKTKSPLIATFDADMIPRHFFLMRTVPYFFLPEMEKEKSVAWGERVRKKFGKKGAIGFIQALQSFYNADLFQFNLYAENRIPNEQDYFFRDINIGRNRANASLFVGSNAVLSRAALEEVGGIALDTITEDFETGLRIQEKGYRCYALAKPLAHGLAPHSIKSLIAQRERWGRGCVQSLKNVGLLFRSNLEWGAKISYFFCLVYWWTFGRRFVYTIAPILSGLFSIHVVECTLQGLLAFWLPYYFLNNYTVSALSGKTRTQHWSNLIDTIIFPYLVLPIIKETIGIKKKKFVVTSKNKAKQEPVSTRSYALPHMYLLLFSALAFVACMLTMIETRGLYEVIIVFWLVVNGKNLLLSIFFMLGRKNFRKADRFYVSLPVSCEYGGNTYKGTTSDISETGMAVRFDFPYFLPNDSSFTVKISSDRYKAEMRCEVTHVDPIAATGAWRYSFKIVDVSEDNWENYLQIVYDRDHTLPTQIIETLTVYDDFSINIVERLGGSTVSALRSLPRIPFGIEAVDAEGRMLTIVDFNYKYAWIQGETEAMRQALSVAPGVSFEIEPTPGVEARNGERLYSVTNFEELLASEAFRLFLAERVEQNKSGSRQNMDKQSA